MQIALAERHFGFASDQTTMDWQDRYSEAFGQLVGTRPEILDRFSADPTGALAEAERFLYANVPAEGGRDARS
jgi:hypothetical protein